MPIPLDPLDDASEHADVIGWLRVIAEEDGRGMVAALFETSVSGEPLSFCFTRAGFDDVDERGGPACPDAVSALLKALLQTATASLTLLVGSADEIPPAPSSATMRVRVPFCLLGPAGNPSPPDVAEASSTRRPAQQVWVTPSPQGESAALRLLHDVLDASDPLEPFERAAKGLREAFDDAHVRALAGSPGLATVVSLRLPAPGRRRPHTQPDRAGALPLFPDRDPGDGNPDRDDPIPRAHTTLADRLRQLLRAPAEPPRLEQLEWDGDLMPFQRDGVRALLENRRLLLADDMGLGKTVQAIAAIRILHARGEVGSCLVAAPASILDQWRREIAKWAPELSAMIIRGPAADREWQWAARPDVTLAGYESLRADYDGRLSRRVWDIVIADEAQRIKNRNATSDVLKRLKRCRSWALTGTPIENHEEELASILEFVDHDEGGCRRRYRPGPRMRERHGELQLRRKKGDVLEDLPPKLVAKIPIQLNARQRRSYDKAEQDGIVYLRSLGAEVGVQHVLELITRLKQICNADPRTGESSKLDDIRDRLGQLVAQGHKALIFSQYSSDSFGVAFAARHLRDFAPLLISGDVPQVDRAGIIERFRTHPEHKVLLLSLRVGGLGLNLQNASYVFHLDRWWNPATERQAEDRTHRLGQTVKVHVIKYSCAGTIEERIDRILESKQELFEQLVDDVSLDLSSRMSSEELFGLFDL